MIDVAFQVIAVSKSGTWGFQIKKFLGIGCLLSIQIVLLDPKSQNEIFCILF